MGLDVECNYGHIQDPENIVIGSHLSGFCEDYGLLFQHWSPLQVISDENDVNSLLSSDPRTWSPNAAIQNVFVVFNDIEFQADTIWVSISDT